MVQEHIVVIGVAQMDTVTDPRGRPMRFPGGSSANVAYGLGRLGNPVVMETWLARDPEGLEIAERLESAGVVVHEASWGAARTGEASVSVHAYGNFSYEYSVEWDPTPPLPVLPTARIVHTGSIAAVMEPGASTVREAIEQVRRDALITYDPNARPSVVADTVDFDMRITPLLANADVIKASEFDLDYIRGGISRQGIIDIWLSMGCSLVVITGEVGGCEAWTRDGVHVRYDGSGVRVVDKLAAGDAFTAGLIDGLWNRGLRGADAREALARIGEDALGAVLGRAQSAAEYSVQRRGIALPLASDLPDPGW